MSAPLAFVTAAAARGLDPDEPLLVEAMARRGIEVAVVVWDDPAVDWAGFSRVVLRSAWDYAERLDEFMSWARRVAAVTELWNPLELIAFSADKHYLEDLRRAGVAVSPTAFCEPGAGPHFPAGDAGFVVKPAVGAGSRDVGRFGPGELERATAHVARLHRRGVAALVQPFLPLVAELGEWPMVYVDGEFSHAANKRVDLTDTVGDLFARELNTPAEATPAMRAVADRAIDHIVRTVGRPVYARIDLVLGLDGEPCVLEAELVEPSLFLPQHPAAVDLVADAFARGLPRP